MILGFMTPEEATASLRKMAARNLQDREELLKIADTIDVTIKAYRNRLTATFHHADRRG